MDCLEFQWTDLTVQNFNGLLRIWSDYHDGDDDHDDDDDDDDDGNNDHGGDDDFGCCVWRSE